MSRSNSRTFVYCRISQDRAGAGLGTERQEQDCRALADRLGFTVSKVYRDDDISAYSGKRRPGYEQMLTDLRAGLGDVVICWHTDRLYRRVADLLEYVKVTNDKGVPTHGVTSGSVDLTTAAGRLMAVQFANMAEYESAHKGERIASKHKQSAENGKWRGGTRPFGYSADGISLDPVEAPLIREAYRQILEGLSLAAIMRGWNEAGIRSSTRYRDKTNRELKLPGKLWNYATIRQVLLRPRNYGASVLRGEVVGVGKWEPIVDESTWRSVKAVLSNPKRRLSSSNKGRWLLAGLARCGVCETAGRVATVRSGTSRSRGTTWSVYRCTPHVHVARRADLCDDYVEQVLLARLQRPDARNLYALMAAQPSKTRLSLEADAHGLRAQLDEAVALYSEGVLSAAQLRTTNQRLRERLAEVEALMVDPAKAVVLEDIVNAPDIAARWESLAWRERREIVDLLMVVTILPVPAGLPRRFSPEHIRIDWRAGE